MPPLSFNMADYVLTAGRATPDKVALEVVGGAPFSLTHAQLESAVLGAAAGLLQQGAKRGDHVMLRLANTPLFPIAYLACIAVGLIPIPTSSMLTQAEVNKFSSVVHPKWTIASDDLPVLASAHTITADQLESFFTCSPAQYDMGSANRAAYIVFTSGTSSTPRAVLHAHRAVWARRSMIDGWYGLCRTDKLLHAGAFNWTYTMGTGLIDPWTVGATSLIPAEGVEPERLPALLDQHKATIFAAAPGIYRKLLRQGGKVIPSLRHGLSAGEKLPETTRAEWERTTGTPIHEAYGMSECSTFISGCPARPAPPQSLGFVQSGRKVRLGEDGMIEIHREDLGLMIGYYNDPDETAARFDGDWFRTGDVASVTSDGATRYEGRSDDVINAGGLRVSPIEIEEALTRIAPTHEWACTEVSVSIETTVIAAFHVGPNMIDQNEIKADLAEHLAAYKIPRVFAQVKALPRGANNKLLRKVLRQNWNTDHGQT